MEMELVMVAVAEVFRITIGRIVVWIRWGIRMMIMIMMPSVIRRMPMGLLSQVVSPVTAMPMIDESIPKPHPHQKVSHIRNHPYLQLVTFMQLTTTTPATTTITITTHQVDRPSITARMVLVEHQVLHHQDTLVEK